MKNLLNKIPKKVKIAGAITAGLIANAFYGNSQTFVRMQTNTLESKGIKYEVAEIGEVEYLITPNDNAPCGYLFAYPEETQYDMNIKGEIDSTHKWKSGKKTPYSKLKVYPCECEDVKQNSTNPNPNCEKAKIKNQTIKTPQIGYIEFEIGKGKNQTLKKMGYNLIENENGLLEQGFYDIPKNKKIYSFSGNPNQKFNYTIEGEFCTVLKRD